ncbi:PqqD family protein [Coleofasciculus sp. H7-2]|uniref:PqqD family protein n=1 Tax=Coleofasciculus sp. H7-2 TaxID=3351545 RepID=UPI00367082BE
MNHSEIFKVNAPKVVHETIDGEVVIVNLDKGDYYSLVKVGADIWEEIIKGTSKSNIIQKIIQCYEGDRQNIENTVNDFIARLQQEELIIFDGTEESKDSNIASLPTTTNGKPEKLTFSPPSLEKYTDMEELLALDPIHEVNEVVGWPNVKVEV